MITSYLYKNLCWQFNKHPFDELLAATTTENQYFDQLAELSADCLLSRAVETTETEFCLNKLALSRPSTDAEKYALSRLGEFWHQYIRLKQLFGQRFMLFPADCNATRIEQIAALLCKCTQFAFDADTERRLVDRTCLAAKLTEREQHYLPDVVRLFKIKYYCAAASRLLEKKPGAEAYLARFLQPTLLKNEFTKNTLYTQAAYSSEGIASVVNCMGNSSVRLGTKPTYTETSLAIYSNGRNVFDTFVQSRFGQRHAEFASNTNSVRVEMRYFLRKNMETRNIKLVNNGKRARRFTVQLSVRNTKKNATYFRMGNALCMATDIFAAVAVVHDAQTKECLGDREQLFDITLQAGACYEFDVVTVFADNSPEIAEALTMLGSFGATRCPYLCDSACQNLTTGDPIILTPHGCTAMRTRPLPSRQIKYSYQLGKDVASFLDNDGNATTLLKGFVFSVQGEGVYSVQGGLARKLNEQTFRLEGDKLVYERKNSLLTISHGASKVYDVQHKRPTRTLFYFPLENRSQISFDKEKNLFTVKDEERQYTICCTCPPESYTTNALECSEEKLRYKLGNNCSGTSCLAICFAPSDSVSITLKTTVTTPCSAPIIRESLVSTYLNYVNDKNVFCFYNHLKCPDCLSVAAICYTNPEYVRRYIEKAANGTAVGTYYYDTNGTKQPFYDKMAFPLATVYYINLVEDLPTEIVKKAHGVLFCEDMQGKQLCVKALALLKAAKLDCFDRVRCLVEYSKLKKLICADVKLFAYAQAIGALPMLNPSKERLKDLCNKYDISKSWYYVSQLENIYGLSISAGKLHIAPTVTTENVLEQFALNIAGKRIDTSFAKNTIQCMTLNGQRCFAPFYAPSLKNEQNNLVVSY